VRVSQRELESGKDAAVDKPTIYSIYLMEPGQPRLAGRHAMVECRSDAAALFEACQLLRQAGEDEIIEVWRDDRQIVRLGDRAPSCGATRSHKSLLQ
jgi:hypothetical protein